MIALALVHYPVVNRRGEVIISAVTNLDIHDIARLARTYGVTAFYIVTPLEEQQSLVRSLVDHWQEGVGGQLNPDRREALKMVRIVSSVQEVKDGMAMETGSAPRVVATTAKGRPGVTSWRALRQRLAESPEEAVLLLVGTASGLAEEILQDADDVLVPIEGKSDYNHLSVRTAAAIMVDRLIGREDI